MAVVFRCIACRAFFSIDRQSCPSCGEPVDAANKNVWIRYYRAGADGKRVQRKRRLGNISPRKAAEIEQQLRSGQPANTDRLDNVLGEYLRLLKVKGAHLGAVLTHCRRLLDAFGRNTDVAKISKLDILRFRESMVNAGYSQAYIDRHLQTFRAACNAIVGSCVIGGKDLFHPDNRVFRTLTSDEIQSLLLAARDTSPYMYDLILVAINTGLRQANVLNLRWSEVDLENSWIRVVQKGGRHLSIPINDTVREVISRRIGTHEEFVFSNPSTGQPYVGIRRAWERIKKKAGINKPFRWHDLRHVYAIKVLEVTGDITYVQELLGHNQIQTTMRYLNRPPERLRRAVDSLGLKIQQDNE